MLSRKRFALVSAPADGLDSSVAPEPLATTSAATLRNKRVFIIDAASYLETMFLGLLQGFAIAPRIIHGIVRVPSDLPDGNGLELCLWTRSQPALEATKVILCSGRLRPDLERPALEAGAVAFIAKPVGLDQFRATILSHVPLEP